MTKQDLTVTIELKKFSQDIFRRGDVLIRLLLRVGCHESSASYCWWWNPPGFIVRWIPACFVRASSCFS